MLGGWTYSKEISPYDAHIFYSSIGTHDDYFYIPVAVATQLVNGTNYKFIAIAEPKKENEVPFFAVVEIYKPIHDAPYITSIYAI